MFVVKTRLPSNLEPTTCKRVHVVTRGHFRSRDEDGGHTVRSAIAEDSMLHANLVAPCFIEPEIWPLEVLHCGIFDLLCFCDLDLDSMTFMYELYQISWRCTGCAKMNFVRQGFRKLSYLLHPANACISLHVVTSGHVTKMAVTPFDPP